MKLEKKIDPESNRPLKALKKTYPRGLNGISDIKERRKALLEKVQKMKSIFPPSSNVMHEDYFKNNPDYTHKNDIKPNHKTQEEILNDRDDEKNMLISNLKKLKGTTL